MKDSLFENEGAIKEQLKQLGFSNAEEIIHNAVPILLLPEKGLVELSDINNSDHGVNFNFYLRKSTAEPNWQLQAIDAYKVVGSIRDERGLVVLKSFEGKDGPFPHRDEMQDILLKQAEIEKGNEFDFLNESAKKARQVAKMMNSAAQKRISGDNVRRRNKL